VKRGGISVFHAENRRPQRMFRRDRVGVCGARSDTTIVDEAQCSVASCRFSLSNTVSFLEVFGVSRARSTVHNWVHKATLQPESGRSPDHVAVDKTVIRSDDEQYWLYAAVDPDLNELPHTKLKTTRKTL